MPTLLDFQRDIRPLNDGRIEVITTHINADFDALASMIAAGKLYPNAVLVFPGSQERNLRNFYIQSIIYLFNVAKVKEINPGDVGRLILVDTRQASRIGPLKEILANDNLSVHIYDHHPDSKDDLKGDVEVLAKVGSNATIMTEVLTSAGIAISPEEATLMAIGIYEDTGSFTFQSTTPRDYKAAAYLLERGADLNVVAEMTSRELTTEQVALLYEMISSVQTHTYNGVEVAIAQATSESYIEELAVLVHKMMDMQNFQVLVAMVHMENRVYLVARSRLPLVDVAEIARAFGGGGHPSAAAATIKNTPLTQAIEKLIGLIPAALGPVRTAGDIMVHPVISIKPEEKLTQARELLIRYNINVLLVVDGEGDIVGYVSRQDVAKALYHGLTDYPVGEFVTTEFGTVGPDATFAEIQTLIVDQKQRILPVTVAKKPVGVITRTDLLTIFTSDTDVPGSLIENGNDKSRTKRIKPLMRERLPKSILELLMDIGRTADQLGYGAYVIGGFVRDIFLRQENLDIDIVVEGDAIQFAEVFARNHPGVRVKPHRKFNTARIVMPDEFKLDVTTARLEYYEYPGALPVVEKGSLSLDLYRRDFTVNTLAVALNEKNFGTVIDYFRGMKDLKDGFIRVLHNLSFVEDPTRVFRAIRFEKRFGFRIGKLTLSLIQNAVRHNVFEKLSGKRLLGEVRLILQEEDPLPAIERMAEFDLLKFLHPRISFGKRSMALMARIKKVRDWYDLTYLQGEYDPWLIYFIGLLDGLDIQEMTEAADRLIPKKRERIIMIEEKPWADKALSWLARKKTIKNSDVYMSLKSMSTETILFMMAKTNRDSTKKMLAGYFTRLQFVKTELTGDDLKKMGFAPGPEFKEILNSVLEGRLNEELHSKEDELEFVRKNYLKHDKGI